MPSLAKRIAKSDLIDANIIGSAAKAIGAIEEPTKKFYKS